MACGIGTYRAMTRIRGSLPCLPPRAMPSMPESFTSLLGRVTGGESLDRDAMYSAIDHIMSGEADEGTMGLFLTALAAKGETAEEVAGAATAMREHMTPIRHRHEWLLDTCGTGGGGSELFNVSTTAAL